ncbi:MAG: HAD family hydrolase [Anaerolineales bacterium]|nr:HAD family hydrolase [Anaerolineales bacterium]
MIRVVAFDADDTLWNNEVLYKRAEKRFDDLMHDAGFTGSAIEVLNAVESRNVPLYGYGIKSFTLSMIEAAVDIGDGFCKSEWIRSILTFSKEILDSDVELFPHTLATLETLSKKFDLMLITKGELSEQERKIQRTGVADFFDNIEILGSKHVGAYQAVLQKHRISPETFLMVGNSLRSDILPVVSLGGHAVYVPYENTWVYEYVSEEDIDDSAYQTIDHLGLLPQALQALND